MQIRSLCVALDLLNLLQALASKGISVFLCAQLLRKHPGHYLGLSGLQAMQHVPLCAHLPPADAMSACLLRNTWHSHYTVWLAVQSNCCGEQASCRSCFKQPTTIGTMSRCKLPPTLAWQLQWRAHLPARKHTSSMTAWVKLVPGSRISTCTTGEQRRQAGAAKAHYMAPPPQST